jgi:prevent-host-death family protein
MEAQRSRATVRALSREGAKYLEAVGDSKAWIPVTRHGRVVGQLGPAAIEQAVAWGLLEEKSEVGIREFSRGNMSAIVERVASGESLLITRHHRPTAAMLPLEEARRLGVAPDLFADAEALGEPGAPLDAGELGLDDEA